MKLSFLRLLVLLLPSALCAQTATLHGQIADESGALVQGAKITLNGPNGLARTTASGNDGSYSLAGLPTGDYVIQASTPDLGMLPASLTLNPGVQTMNLQLKLAATRQQVTVEDTAGPLVSTDASSNASSLVMKGDDLQALSDDPDDLQADLQALAGPSAGPSGGAIFVDGFSGGDLPAKNTIREVRVNQNPFSPEYDHMGLGRIEIFTKPGTDKFHATIPYNFGDNIWNGRNPYAAQKAPLVLNELESSGSGPLGKRASFTLDVQRQAIDNGSIINAIDPNSLLPFTGIVTTPQRRVQVTPRIDYQLNDNNTFTVRYGFITTDIHDFGIGGFNLAAQGLHRQSTSQTVQATDTVVFGSTINETRLQYYRNATQWTANNTNPEIPNPEIQVLGAFNNGGSQVGNSFDTQNSLELQNITSIVHGAHAWRFGLRLRGQTDDNVSPQNFNGTFTFSSLDQYRLALLGQATPAQFSISQGTPGLSVHQADAGLFAGDDWRVLPNLTLNLGLRYEVQSNIHDWRDFAPRIGFAWAPGGTAQTPRPKTVLRGGFGMFYDRFGLANTLAADRYNGSVQQQYVITNPTSYPAFPTLAGSQPQVVQEVDSHLRAPYLMQSAFTAERQLPAGTTLAVTFTNSHGLHELRSLDINAPLPQNGLFPYGTANPIFLMTSSGLYNQNQVIANVNTKVSSAVSLFGFYVLNKAMSNTDGLGTFPANPYNWAGEYGPAFSDVRHRVNAGGSINTKWNVRFSPLVVLQSGPPFNLTVGRDVFGTTLFNGRPGIATNPSLPGLISTQYGLLDPNPTPGEPIVPRNHGRGPGLINVNLRVSKTFAFGPEKNPGKAPSGGSSIFSNPAIERRYNLMISMSVRNLLNHTNPGPIIGDITSPLFGQANQIAGAPNGEGFSENAGNRRLELQTRFTF